MLLGDSHSTAIMDGAQKLAALNVIHGGMIGGASEALQGRKAEPRIGQAGNDGPNDWKWQEGLATHEWNAAEHPVLTGLGTEGPG